LVLGDNQWAKDHAWLVPVLWVLVAIFAFAALAATRWFRRLFGSQFQIVNPGRIGPSVGLKWVWENQGTANYHYYNSGDEEALNPVLTAKIGDRTIECLPPQQNLMPTEESPVFVSVPHVQPSKPLAAYIASLNSSEGIDSISQREVAIESTLVFSSPCQNAQFRQWPNFDELDRRFVSG
jgi:hypothetical protein